MVAQCSSIAGRNSSLRESRCSQSFGPLCDAEQDGSRTETVSSSRPRGILPHGEVLKLSSFRAPGFQRLLELRKE